MEDEIELNEGHILEAIDRIHVAIMYLESSLSEHALLGSVTEFQNEIGKSIDILGNLYQTVGSLDSISDLSKNYDLRKGYKIRE
jgi:hypothetical protein